MPFRLEFNSLMESLAKFGVRRLLLMAATALTVLGGVGLASYYLGRPSMQPIYTGLSAQDVSRMTAALAEAGLSFDVNEQRSAVLVPFGQAARARSLLAQKGLPTSSRAGYELFDQMGTLGLTSFMQEVTRVRALEGEIARTIQTLDGVAAARVHLVLPDPGSFRRERRDPSASVILRMDGRWQTTAANTVRLIVAAAVPGMKVEQVNVASTDGRMLASGGDEQSLGSMRLAEIERSMAAELEQRASRTLGSTVGHGNYQVSVTVRLDVDRQQINETVFDPKSRVERSVRVVKQSGSTEDGGGRANVGAEANLPREEAGQSEAERRRQREDRREELVNYELNSKTVQTVREGYRVNRLAVAVVIDRKQIESQLGSQADATAVDRRLAELKRLIAAALGANPERDDQIEIAAVDFKPADVALTGAASPGLLDYVLMNLGTIISSATLLAVVLVLAFFGLRPLTRAMERSGAPAELAPVARSPQIDSGNDQGARAVGVEPARGSAEAPQLAIAPDSAPQRASREDAVRERLQALVAADDSKVTAVLKGWMAQGAEA